MDSMSTVPLALQDLPLFPIGSGDYTCVCGLAPTFWKDYSIVKDDENYWAAWKRGRDDSLLALLTRVQRGRLIRLSTNYRRFNVPPQRIT